MEHPLHYTRQFDNIVKMMRREANKLTYRYIKSYKHGGVQYHDGYGKDDYEFEVTCIEKQYYKKLKDLLIESIMTDDMVQIIMNKNSAASAFVCFYAIIDEIKRAG
jgi:hypothetical protein